MAETKECFGRCGSLSIRYRAQAKEHYVVSDPDKMQECNGCSLFTTCMFQTYNDIIKYLVRLIDSQGRDSRPRIG